MKVLDVVLHSLYQLSLVFAYGASDVGAHKQGVEAREDSEHLVGVLCRSQLVSESSSDSGLHTFDLFFISVRGVGVQCERDGHNLHSRVFE